MDSMAAARAERQTGWDLTCHGAGTGEGHLGSSWHNQGASTCCRQLVSPLQGRGVWPVAPEPPAVQATVCSASARTPSFCGLSSACSCGMLSISKNSLLM